MLLLMQGTWDTCNQLSCCGHDSRLESDAARTGCLKAQRVMRCKQNAWPVLRARNALAPTELLDSQQHACGWLLTHLQPEVHQTLLHR